MAFVRKGFILALSLTLWAAAAQADQPHGATTGLYDRPVLVIDPGMHTAPIWRASADAEDRWAVTGSDDETVRVWSLADGALLRTIRPPAGPGYVGRVFAVAMSPDGAVVASGGLTRWTDADPQEQIYLFDRASGLMVKRIDGLPNLATQVVFSPDGRRLAVMLFSNKGLRLYDRDQGWAEIARDGAYGDSSFGASFAPDGRLATTAYDGKVRLYLSELKGTVRPDATIDTSGGSRPYGIAFSPDGTRLAIGYGNSKVVSLLDGHTLGALPGPDTDRMTALYLNEVAWSRDGSTLFAAGRIKPVAGRPVFAWSDRGAGARRTLAAAGRNSVISLVPVLGGDLLVAAADPWLARLREDGTASWAHEPPSADYRGQSRVLSVSTDGTLVDFGTQANGKAPAQFDLALRTLTPDPPHLGRTAAPRLDGLALKGWEETQRPMLDGQPLQLYRNEWSHSLTISPAGDRFVLGTEWSLRAFDAKGTQLWRRPVPGIAWGVNITGDGRLVVAAYCDGTTRWHRMSDGVELLAFMPLPNRTDWVAWTPEGFYTATPGAHGILRWHVNHGWDAPADSIPIEDIPGSFRPPVLPLVLQELETPHALGLAVLAEHNKEVAIRTHSQLPPGVQLHLLTIGISAYNEDHAKNLRLHYADRDAHDLASAIVSTQEGLYSHVTAQSLLDKDANRGGVLRALQTLRTEMERGGGNDLAVVHFSGHGAMVDGTLYLLPYETDARDAVGIKNTALSIDTLRGELLKLAEHGRVLVLLDACHSGAIAQDGSAQAIDSAALRSGPAAANVTVLTSSSGREVSFEDDKWQHGAFTRALLDALNDPAADTDHIGLINPNALAHYVARHVASLTGGKQTPDMEVRFDTTVFAVGM
jgi:WD40 repeat protein